MWAKLAQLFFHRPDLVLNHIEAYAQQAGREISAAKKSLSITVLCLVLAALALVLAIGLLGFALMLDAALPALANRVWLYATPSILMVLAALVLYRSWCALQRYATDSELKRQAQADFALLRTLAQKKTEG